MCIGLKQQYKFYRSLSNRPDRIVPIIINRNEFLSYQTNQVESNQQIKRNGRKQKKSNGMEGNKRNESNQIKSTQTQEMITQHGFDFYEYHMKSIPQYLSTRLYFDLDWTFS